MTFIELILGAIGWLALTFGAAWLGSRFLPDDWYKNLKKPGWNPPNKIFGPVWSVLYLFMAVAAWLVWRSYGFSMAAFPLVLFVVQLLLNTAWTWTFFGLHRPSIALVDIVVLWMFILATLTLFWQFVPLAGILLLPYLAWVTFASYLNLTIWRMNR
jgi:tryptophan-rich sensory protein